MKTGKIILALCLMFSVLCAGAQTKPKNITVIDGYFFYEMPVSRHHITNVYMLQAPNGTQAVGYSLAIPLSNEILGYAVSKDEIPEGEMLLRRYNEAKEGGHAFSVRNTNKILLKAGDQFPNFTATDIDGKKWTSADVKGKVMVLNLWYTGCGPCRTEMPELSTWKNEMPDVMYFSSTFEEPETVRSIFEAQKFNWTHLVNDTLFYRYIGNHGYPMTIIVDKKGVVSMVEYGTSSIQRNIMKERIAALRKEQMINNDTPTIGSTAISTPLLLQVLGCLALAILILVGKGDWFIAGYNTASKEEKEQCNIKRLRVIVSVVLVLLACLTALRDAIGSSLMGVIILLICIVAIILANTWAKK